MPVIAHVSTEVLRNCGLIRNPQQTTHTHPMWGQFQAVTCQKSSTLFGNLANNLTTAEILKTRDFRKADPGSVGKKVKGYFAELSKAKPNGKVACEMAAKNLGTFFQNPRPPEP